MALLAHQSTHHLRYSAIPFRSLIPFPDFRPTSNDLQIHAENLIEKTIVCRCIVAFVACAWLADYDLAEKRKRRRVMTLDTSSEW
ncbi:hypothetical protein WN51_06038 [Melipona quadrifasciata]|uniref:Uncharacterized protein n=1 Tax=Melipona quadrifasciata TaxID=166423 RepID=A0A0M8ZRU8_9HYME|nr:hypothetical protein WN51_06038 [Melipona quadrifasciata]